MLARLSGPKQGQACGSLEHMSSGNDVLIQEKLHEQEIQTEARGPL